MPKKTKPISRPDLEDMQTEEAPPVSVITQDDRDEVAQNQIPEPGEQLDGMIESLRARVRVPEGASYTEILQAILDGKWSRRVVLLTPFNRPINPHAHFAMVAHIRKSPWVGYEYETDTVIQRARNLLADRFMKSEAEWAMWMDQDTVSPFGHPGWFYTRMGFDQNRVKPPAMELNAIPRLLSHGKKIVGGVYRQRKPNGLYVIQPHLHPRGPEDKALVQQLQTHGPFDQLVEVGYVATGCALVHRTVYTDIQNAHPELGPKVEGDIWNYYGTDTNQSGEDIAFCKLAADAGHKSYLDCGLFCGHLGETCYVP